MDASTTRTLLIHIRKKSQVYLLETPGWKGRPLLMAPNDRTRWGGPSVFLHYVFLYCLSVSPSWLELLQPLLGYPDAVSNESSR